MSLFQKSVLNKYLNTLNQEEINLAWNKFIKHFHNSGIQENIRNSKEEQYQEGFLRDLFVAILGYKLNPESNFNLTTELKNLKGTKKTDGAILYKNKAIAVIELKGTNTVDLSKVEAQAFGYKNNQPECTYVITSNFEKLRFYIDNAVDFEEFNLFQLNKAEFKLLWLCLSANSLLKNVPKQIKEESLTHEEIISEKLYKDYSQFRNEIFDNIEKNNPQHDKILLFKKTQKLLDRFLFIFFAEDRGLLPPNSIREILRQWTELKDEYDAYATLYSRFKKYFGYLNTGHVGKKYEIFSYNGGLFAKDNVLDSIEIDDQLLYSHTLKLSDYDFESEVSVNILGHIFEHSLTDIENIQAKIQGIEIDKSKSKRKKDGVFYTPKYITKYIVDNTVGKLCAEKKDELGIQEDDYEKGGKGRRKTTLKILQSKIDEYREWLLKLSICDPACGSGAFLVQALDFLTTEHSFIDELQAKIRGGIVMPYVVTDILENNLYGVDINEESVEIAKLSLWLHTAKKGRKLTTLSDNLKCGNSLISDPEVAGEKAFNWQKEFPNIFTLKDKQAFHIVLTTHNSRTSERMLEYNVTQGEPTELDLQHEIELTKIISQIIKEQDYNCLAYNICKDHVHMVLVCEYEELSTIVKTIKGKSSYLYQSKGFKPLGTPLWSQKFFRAELDDWQEATQSQKTGYQPKDSYLENTLEYILHNRKKHELPESKELQKIINNFIVSGAVAFREEYKGGFDVVIGNPPYLRIQGLKDAYPELTQYYEDNYISATGNYDIYILFLERAFYLLNKNGVASYIMPHKFLIANFGKGIRKFLTENTAVAELVHFGAELVFQDATTYTCIISLSKKEKTSFGFKRITPNQLFNQKQLSEIHYNKLGTEQWILRLKSLLTSAKPSFIQ